MKSILEPWGNACAASSALRFIDINLRGTGQVMFQNNPLTGMLFLLAIAWGSYTGGAGEVFVGGLLGLVTATLMAMWLRVDAQMLRDGLFGYNGILVGLALPTFLPPSPLLWAYVVIGAAVSVVAMLGTANVTKAWSVSALTFPFVITTWLLLLAAAAFAEEARTVMGAAEAISLYSGMAASSSNLQPAPYTTVDLEAEAAPSGSGFLPDGPQRHRLACGRTRGLARLCRAISRCP